MGIIIIGIIIIAVLSIIYYLTGLPFELGTGFTEDKHKAREGEYTVNMDIIERIKALKFPTGEYVVVGSSLLHALGLRTANDIDVAVLPTLLKKLKATGKWKEEYRYNKLFLAKDDIDVITQLNWEDYPTTVERAVETALLIDGVPFLNLQETIKFKKALGREKDVKDIELLVAYQKNHEENFRI